MIFPLTSLFVLSGWAFSLVFSVVLARRYEPAKAWAWMAILLAFPWVGLGLYFLLGENPLGRRRLIRYRQVVEELKDSKKHLVLEPHVKQQHLEHRLQTLSRVALAGGALSPVGGNDAALLVNSDATMARLVQDIDRAQHHVHLTFYIFRDDATGRQVGDALLRAAARGVKCRLLADAVGSRPLFAFAGYGAHLQQHGIELRDALYVNPLRGRLARIDLRNHRKIVIIDGQVGYIGSWNVCDADYGRRDIPAGHDVMVRLTGPVALQLQLLFLEDWKFEADQLLEHDDFFPELESAGNIIAQVLPSGPMYPTAPLRDLTVAALHQAQKNVNLTTPYLIPDEALLLALKQAVQRGVKVVIIVPAHSNHHFIDLAARAYYRELTRAGVNVHLFQKGLLHAKTLTVDDALGMVGSANFDVRSFHLDVEANCLFYAKDFTSLLHQQQLDYISQSVLFDAQNPSWPQTLTENWFKLISPLF